MKDWFEIHGHRGARGLYPENSINGFVYCAERQISAIELDVVILRDGKVVVSHDPFFDATFCTIPNLENNLYKFTSDQLKTVDCGSVYHNLFPFQKKQPAYKPLLSDVLSVLGKCQKTKTLINLEIKSEEKLYGSHQPKPKEFVDLVLEVVNEFYPSFRWMIQSFDIRILEELNQKWNGEISYLIENEDSFEKNLDKLSFLPTYYNPEYVLVGEVLVSKVHDRGMKIVPWTVNDNQKALELYNIGVDGIISDYPVHIKRYLEAFAL